MLMYLWDDRVQHHTTQIIHLKIMSKSIWAASMTVVNISIPVLIQDQNLFSEVIDLSLKIWLIVMYYAALSSETTFDWVREYTDQCTAISAL